MPIEFVIDEKPKKKGGKLSVKNISGLLKKSYDTKLGDYGDYLIDRELSDDRAQVYKKRDSGEAVVVHRGTKGLGDIYTDMKLALGYDIKKGDRYKHAQDIQKKAETKYGKENISTLGHSLGSHLSSEVGQDSKEIINLNKAVVPKDIGKKTSSKEFNIRTELDPVSALSKTQVKNDNDITIPSKTLNPLAEHSTDTLERLDQDLQVGRGHLKLMTMKQLKNLVKKLPKKEPYLLKGKKKNELVDYCCDRCGLK